MSYIIYCITGIIGGILMGLVGFGIGPIAVPCVALTLSWIGISKNILMQIAIATSLSVIVTNTFFTTLFHKNNNNINLNIFYKLLPGSLIGALLGSLIVIHLPEFILKQIFAIILIIITFIHLSKKNELITFESLDSKKLFIYSVLIAVVSNLIGVSDGILMVPFLTKCNLNIKESIGTATALVLPVSLMGLIPLIIFGFKCTTLPSHSFGYIYLPAFIIIALTSIKFSYWAIKFSKFLSDKTLKNIFCIVMIGVSLVIIFNA